MSTSATALTRTRHRVPAPGTITRAGVTRAAVATVGATRRVLTVLSAPLWLPVAFVVLALAAHAEQLACDELGLDPADV